MVISVKKDMAVYFSRLTKIIGHAFFDRNDHFFLPTGGINRKQLLNYNRKTVRDSANFL